MKATAIVFAASTVRKERILLILRSWKYKTLHNWFTCISTERDSSKNTQRFRTDLENSISQSWKTIELALTCFSFDFDPMAMRSVLSSFILSLFPFIQTPTSSMLDVMSLTRLENSEGAAESCSCSRAVLFCQPHQKLFTHSQTWPKSNPGICTGSHTHTHTHT